MNAADSGLYHISIYATDWYSFSYGSYRTSSVSFIDIMCKDKMSRIKKSTEHVHVRKRNLLTLNRLGESNNSS